MEMEPDGAVPARPFEDMDVMDEETRRETQVAKGNKPLATKKTGAAALRVLSRCLLQVFVTKAEKSYMHPWHVRPQKSGKGSAFVIDAAKRRIITNAHVVEDATVAHVRRLGVPKRWPAKVLHLSRVCDLALLTVEEDAFWTGMEDVDLVDTPHLQDQILVCGFPIGGDSLSITSGIVSRVTLCSYGTSTNKLLAIQIDAAINSGNSGGPVFLNLQERQVAGVAFLKHASSSADNIGYIIPKPVVDNFLQEIEVSGHVKYCCTASVGFLCQPMENPYLREKYKLSKEQSGCLVFRISPLSVCSQHLKIGDIILEIDGQPLADDGTITFRDDERLSYAHTIRMKMVGETLHLKVLREGSELNLSYPIATRDPLVPEFHNLDCVPTYFIIGGLVFVPVTIPFMHHALGSQWRRGAPIRILNAMMGSKCAEDEQIIILHQILVADINFGYKQGMIQLKDFNGTPIRNLQHLAYLVDTCEEEFMEFTLDFGFRIVFRTTCAREESQAILEQHAVPHDRSPNLQECAGQRPELATAVSVDP